MLRVLGLTCTNHFKVFVRGGTWLIKSTLFIRNLYYLLNQLPAVLNQ